MSMRSWTENGYGYHLFGDDNMPKIKEFIIKNQKLMGIILDWDEDIQEAEDQYDLEEILGKPVAWWIAEAINKLENEIVIKGFLFSKISFSF